MATNEENQSEPKPEAEKKFDSRPLFVLRIYEELLTDSQGRRYRRGAGWQFKAKKESESND